MQLIKILCLVVSFLLATSAFAQDAFQSPKCKGVLRGEAARENGQRVVGLDLTLEPLGVDFDHVLPRTKTERTGRYRFEHICPSRYTVRVEGEGHGHPAYYHLIFRQLTSRVHEVRLTAEHLDANLPVDVPPKPDWLVVRAIDRQTKAEISDVTVRMTLPGTPNNPLSELGPASREGVPVPPDRDVLVHLNSDGFREAKETEGSGKVVHISSGTRVTMRAHLDPLNHSRDGHAATPD
jgi:hypothetical protein